MLFLWMPFVMTGLWLSLRLLPTAVNSKQASSLWIGATHKAPFSDKFTLCRDTAFLVPVSFLLNYNYDLAKAVLRIYDRVLA